MLPVLARLLPRGYLRPVPAGASTGEFAVVDEAERGWPKFICGRLSRLILCSGRVAGAMFDRVGTIELFEFYVFNICAMWLTARRQVFSETVVVYMPCVQWPGNATSVQFYRTANFPETGACKSSYNTAATWCRGGAKIGGRVAEMVQIELLQRCPIGELAMSPILA